MTKSRGINKPSHRWTKKEFGFLCRVFQNMPSAEIAKIMGLTIEQVRAAANRKGLHKSESFLASPASGRLRAGDNRIGLGSQFQKGKAPWSKGKKLGIRGNMAKTMFKKGNRPLNAVPVGTVVMATIGYLKVKIKEPNTWRWLHRKNWEEAHGKPPEGSIIFFKDNNRENCAIENLDITTHQGHLEKHTIARFPPEIRKAIHALAKLKRTIRKKKEDTIEKQD